MQKKIKVGFMYSENDGIAPHNSLISGWPTGITYASVIEGIMSEGGTAYNLKWSDVGDDLRISRLRTAWIIYLNKTCFNGLFRCFVFYGIWKRCGSA